MIVNISLIQLEPHAFAHTKKATINIRFPPASVREQGSWPEDQARESAEGKGHGCRHRGFQFGFTHSTHSAISTVAGLESVSPGPVGHLEPPRDSTPWFHLRLTLGCEGGVTATYSTGQTVQAGNLAFSRG